LIKYPKCWAKRSSCQRMFLVDVTDKMPYVLLKCLENKQRQTLLSYKLFTVYLLIILLQYLVPTSLGFIMIYLYIPLKSVIPIILIIKIWASPGCSHVLDIGAVYPRWVGTSSWQRSKWPSLQLFWSGAELLGDKSRLTTRCQRSRYVSVHVSVICLHGFKVLNDLHIFDIFFTYLYIYL